MADNHEKWSHLPLYAKGPLRCPLQGKSLLNSPLFNKGSAFTKEERQTFGLNGMLPSAVHTLDQQVKRAYYRFKARSSPLAQNVFLNSHKNQNLVLFYALLDRHIDEMYSVIYTPTEGEAIEQYSHLFRRPDGCFLDIEAHGGNREGIESVLREWGGKDDIDYIVVTDAEEILGIGDQGVGGIGISVAKLVLMTLCAGLWPDRTLPIVLDCGTDNEYLLKDDLYLGIRKPRVRGEKYDTFIDNVVQSIKTVFPLSILHFEDFGLPNARRLLETYSAQLPCFNDDIQGTGAVTMAAIHAACQVTALPLESTRILIFGAGTAGTGIADQYVDALLTLKLTLEEARSHVYLVDKPGLLLTTTPSPTSAQKPYLRDPSSFKHLDRTDLTAVINHIKPHILIGTSTHPSSFTEPSIRAMSQHTPHPIILPLSNPTRLIEAIPEDIMTWSNSTALIATGSPFPPVALKDGSSYIVAECNNATIFPALGLALVLTRARLLTPPLLATAVKALSLEAPCLKENDATAALLPDIRDVREVSVRVAMKVVRKIVEEGLNRVPRGEIPESEEELEGWVRAQMWEVGGYREMVKVEGE